MKKILILPDLHGSNKWKQFLEVKPDHTIFLGDYVDSFEATDTEIIENLQEIINYKKNHLDKVTLLWGNHDVQYLHFPDSYWNCSGYRASYAPVIHHLFEENKKLFKIAHVIDNYLFTHAGVLYEWLESFKHLIKKSPLSEQNFSLDELLNEGFNSNFNYKFGEVGYRRGGFKGSNGSPLWADLTEVVKEFDTYTGSPPIPYNQICGHNHSKTHVTLRHSTSRLNFTVLDTGTTNYSPLILII